MARIVLVIATLLTIQLGSTSRLRADTSPLPDSTGSDAARHPQTRCPVMGGHIDKNLYVDVKGKRIYLCCAACEDAVRAEPEKYIEKIESRGETVEKTPPRH